MKLRFRRWSFVGELGNQEDFRFCSCQLPDPSGHGATGARREGPPVYVH